MTMEGCEVALASYPFKAQSGDFFIEGGEGGL